MKFLVVVTPPSVYKALSYVPKTLVLRWEKLDHGPSGEGVAVPDGLHPGDGTLSFQ